MRETCQGQGSCPVFSKRSAHEKKQKSSGSIRQDHAAPVQEEMCDEEVRDIRKIVRDATQGTRNREELGGVKEGWWTEGVGRARAALGRFMSAAPRTLGFPFSMRRFDPSGGLDPPD